MDTDKLLFEPIVYDLGKGVQATRSAFELHDRRIDFLRVDIPGGPSERVAVGMRAAKIISQVMGCARPLWISQAKTQTYVRNCRREIHFWPMMHCYGSRLDVPKGDLLIFDDPNRATQRRRLDLLGRAGARWVLYLL